MRSSAFSRDSLDARARSACRSLLASLQQLRVDNHWSGQLSTSALSTATAISTLALAIQHADQRNQQSLADWKALIARGIHWLSLHQNADGGFGDTDHSHSNIATSYLVLAAHQLVLQCQPTHELRGLDSSQEGRLTTYLRSQNEWQGLRARYGRDKTFVVPIMTNCALAKLVPWSDVSPLPFEAAALPQSWYRFAKMPVVSYAVPALVAIGQCRFHFAPPRNPLLRWLRKAAIPRTRQVLRQMQPQSGGYLEAVPLTSFVSMSLLAMDLAEHPVVQHGLRFIQDSVLEDGSWPIDTNLATWVTSLSTRALAKLPPSLRPDLQPDTINFLLSCQHRVRHPFTGADPGGWGWTNLSGAVPDADDTPAAILALDAYCQATEATPASQPELQSAIDLGTDWLLGLQNRDGGWPTFCRGWGQLPFDRSGADLTAHAIRALWASHRTWCANDSRRCLRIEQAIHRGMRYLAVQQRADGSWLPLWFGNQDHPDEENPIYGTSRVLLCLAELEESPWGAWAKELARPACNFLRRSQNPDGGWGGGGSLEYAAILRERSGNIPSQATNTLGEAHLASSEKSDPQSSIEETALALEALLACSTQKPPDAFIMRGVDSLLQAIEQGWTEVSWPIGFYFAKLWYHERSYPLVYSLAALGKWFAAAQD